MSKYVVLKDRGTIFHDPSQDGTVTGNVPVKLKETPKVLNAIRKGILDIVDDKKAEAQIAKAKGDTKKAKQSTSDSNETKVAELSSANAEKDAKIAELTKQLEEANKDKTPTAKEEDKKPAKPSGKGN